MIFNPNLNIGFYFIRNGSLTCMKNVFGHVKLNLKLSLFQNLDLDYSISPVRDHSNDFSISLFFKIPKSKILTKKKLWSKGGVLREATLLNVQCGRFEVLSNSKTLYGQWRLLGHRADNLHQPPKTKPRDEAQILPTQKRPLNMRKLTLYQLVPLGPRWDTMHSPKFEGGVLGDCMMYAFLIGALGFGFWAKIKGSLTKGTSGTGGSRPSLFNGNPKVLRRCPSTRKIRP